MNGDNRKRGTQSETGTEESAQIDRKGEKSSKEVKKKAVHAI